MNSEELQQHIEEFLAQGGEIEELPYAGDPIVRPTPLAKGGSSLDNYDNDSGWCYK